MLLMMIHVLIGIFVINAIILVLPIVSAILVVFNVVHVHFILIKPK